MATKFSSDGPTDTVNKLGYWQSEIQRVSMMVDAAGGAVMNISDPYQVRYLTLEEVMKGDLGSGSLTRWRHLIASEQHAHGELELDEHDEPVALHEGEGKDGFMAAVQIADDLEDEYEVWVVSCPPIHFVALYLHSESEALLIPYPPNQTPLENYAPVPVSRASEVLAPIAENVANQSAGSEPTAG